MRSGKLKFYEAGNNFDKAKEKLKKGITFKIWKDLRHVQEEHDVEEEVQ